MLYLPKYHSELNPQELFWAKSKDLYRKVNNLSARNMESRIKDALDKTDSSKFFVRRCFRKARDYIWAYSQLWVFIKHLIYFLQCTQVPSETNVLHCKRRLRKLQKLGQRNEKTT